MDQTQKVLLNAIIGQSNISFPRKSVCGRCCESKRGPSPGLTLYILFFWPNICKEKTLVTVLSCCIVHCTPYCVVEDPVAMYRFLYILIILHCRGSCTIVLYCARYIVLFCTVLSLEIKFSVFTFTQNVMMPVLNKILNSIIESLHFHWSQVLVANSFFCGFWLCTFGPGLTLKLRIQFYSLCSSQKLF